MVEEPLIVNVLDQLQGAGDSGLRASRLFALLDMVRPLPAPFVTLQQLVEDGFITSDTAMVNVDSRLRLTVQGREALAAAIAAGVWQCRIDVGHNDAST